MSKKTDFDWLRFRNETASRIAANFAVDHQLSYRIDQKLVATRSIEYANELTIALMNNKDNEKFISETSKYE